MNFGNLGGQRCTGRLYFCTGFNQITKTMTEIYGRSLNGFFAFFFGLALVLPIRAQNNTLYNTPQAPNFDFEVWESAEPSDWNSSACFEAGNSPSQYKRNQSIWSSTDIRPQTKGMYSAYIKVTKSSWYHYKFPFGATSEEVMGTLTTGTLYYYDDKANSKSCIYTNTGDASKCWGFTGRPDSIVFWVKSGDNGGRNSDMTVYLHNNAKLEDRNPNGTAVGTVIGSANLKIPALTRWTRYSVPIAYQSQENPAYLLLSFTAGNNFREVVEGDELWVDDVLFVYNPVLSIDTVSPLQLAHHGSQDITLYVPYTFYSGTQAPLTDGGDNYLKVYLSDENGNFDHATLLASEKVNGGDNIRHQGRIRVQLPANTTDSDKYRLRIEADNYPLQSNEIELNIYKQWYLTIYPASRYGTTNAVTRQLCTHGSRQTAVAAVNNAECRFLRWEENGQPIEGAGAEYGFNITNDRNLTAVFDTTFTLRFATPTGATAYFGNNNLTEITLLNGETAQLRADLDEGYLFRGFYLDPVTWYGETPVHDYTAVRGGTIYVLTDSIPYEYEFRAYPLAKLGTVSGSGTYKHFSTVTAEAKAVSEYSRFSHWEDMAGNVVGNDPVLRIENISKGGSYRAVFDETFYHVSLRVSDPGDGYALQCAQRTADSAYSAFDLTHIYIRAVPSRGIGFRYWEVTRNGMDAGHIEDNPYDVTDNTHLDADYVFLAVFDTLTYHLEVSAQNGYAEGTGTYMYGKQVLLQATPDKGHHFVRWESGSEILGTEDSLRITILHDSVVRAICEPDAYRITIASNDEALGRVDKESGLFLYGSTVELNAISSSGAEFRYWVIDGDTLGMDSSYHLNVEYSCQVLAVFSHTRSHVVLQADNPAYGMVSGAGVYEWHTPVQIRAEAFTGYRFEAWQTLQGDRIEQAGIDIPRIEGDTVLTAFFAPVMFDLTLRVTEGGSAFIGDETGGMQARCPYMDYVRIAAVPQAGYEFEGWYDSSGNLCSTYPQEGFTIKQDSSLEARFVPVRYAVNLFVSPLGAGVLHGVGRYQKDSKVNISVDLSDGYDFLGWYENDEVVETRPAFSIVLEEDRYFTAKFKEKRFSVDMKASPAGCALSQSGAGDFLYAYNTNLYVETLPGYEVAAWTNRKGDTLSRRNPYLHDVYGQEELTAHIQPARMNASFGIRPEEAGTVICGEVRYGVPASATVQAAYGYAFSHWENRAGERIGEKVALSFTAFTDTAFTAVFKPQFFTITGKARNPLRGSVEGGGSYAYLSACTLRITHDPHYHFAGWYNQKGEMLSRQHTWTFTVTEPMDITAYFEPLPVLTHLAVLPENSGTIVYDGGQMQGEVKVLFEDSIRLQAVPAPGMRFSKWTRVDSTGFYEEWSDENHVFLPQGGRRVTAVFDTVSYPLSLSVEPAGAGSVQGGGEYKYGAFAPLLAAPALHYGFYAYMAGDEVLSYDSAYALRMDSAIHVQAVFRPVEYLIRPLSEDRTKGDVGGKGFYPYGSTVQLDAFAWTDSVEFAFWSHSADGRDTVSTQAQMRCKVEDNESLIAFFKPASRLLEVETTGKGRVAGDGSYVHGSEAELMAESASGYHFTAWRERGNWLGGLPEISLTMRQNRQIEAVFEPDTFQVHLVSMLEEVDVFGAGGYANESPVNIWTGGLPFGYRFAAWKNGAGQTVSREAGFILPLTQDTTLYAEFDSIRYRLDLQTQGAGKVWGETEYGLGDTVWVGAVPDTGYRLKAWYYGEQLFSEKDTLTFSAFADLSLKAVFEKDIVPVSPLVNRVDGGEVAVGEASETSETVTLTAHPGKSFHFAYWTLGDSLVNTQEQMEVLRVDASRMVAHFMPDVYYVTLRSSTPEGLSSMSGSGSFNKGDVVNLKATVRQGYEFMGWFEEGADTPVSTQAEHTLTVTRPMRLDARTRKTTNR